MAIAPLSYPGYAAPRDLDFSPLAKLGEQYREAQTRTRLADIGRGIADGSMDYRTAAGQIAQSGDIGTSLKFLALDEAKKKQQQELEASNQFHAGLSGLFTGANPAAAAPAVVNGSASPTLNPVAQPQRVQSSSRVWGDDEAERAGLYEPSSAPVQQQAGTRLPPTDGVRPSAPPVGTQVAQAQPQQAAPSPSANAGFQGIGIQHIPQLLQASANQRLPAADRELASKLLTRALDDARQPDKVRTLQMLKDQSGYQGTILQLEKELRASGSTNVTVDNRQETEEAKAAGRGAGERRGTMFAAAGAAGKTLTQLSRMEGLLNQVSQGKLEPSRLTISAWAKALGMNDEVATSLGLDPKGVGSGQALTSLVNEAVLGKIGAGGMPANNFSDADREFIVDIFPKLSDDPRANKIKIEVARRAAQLDIQRAKDYRDWKSKPGNRSKGFEDFEADYADTISRRDVFGDLRREAETIVGSPRTDIGGTFSNPGAAQQGAAGSLGGQRPPMQGARQAPDGNWYVQRDGKYFKVDQ